MLSKPHFATGCVALALALTQDLTAAILATIPTEPVVVPQTFSAAPAATLLFSGLNGPKIEIFGNSFYYFWQEDPNTSLLVRMLASPVNYPEFLGFAAALAPGALIGTSNWLVNVPHVDAWGEARWGKYDGEQLEADYFVKAQPLRSELSLQSFPAYRNAGQQGGRPYVGLAWRRGDDFHYGWIRFGPSSVLQMLVEGWAWESEPNKLILAGAIPEPTVLALLAACGCLVVCHRRRGQSAAGRLPRVDGAGSATPVQDAEPATSRMVAPEHSLTIQDLWTGRHR